MTGNPLVAPVQDSTKAYTGIGIAEAVGDLVEGIRGGSWVDTGLGAASTGLEALSIVVDPFGSIASSVVAFVMEHVGPLRESLDKLAGNAAAVSAQSRTWHNVATAVGKVHTAYATEHTADTAGWTGKAADAYRARAADVAAVIGAAAEAASGLGSAVEMAGVVVGAVRETVRDLIAEFVGRLTVWALEALTIIGLPAAATQASAAAAKWAARIAQLVKRLVGTMQKLAPLLRRLGELFRRIRKKMDDLRSRGGGDKKPPDDTGKKPKPNGDGSTGPSRDPDPNAQPSGERTKINPKNDADTKRSLQRENESATTLARAGYDIEQNPTVPGGKNPDYRIEGRIFDAIAPITPLPRSIASRIKNKIDLGQADRFVVNLVDSPVDAAALRKQLHDWPIPGLKEVIVIDKSGNVLHLYP
ncbi:CdiA C-terminal domain-containing protein [Saccharothrix stipae]